MAAPLARRAEAGGAVEVRDTLSELEQKLGHFANGTHTQTCRLFRQEVCGAEPSIRMESCVILESASTTSAALPPET